MPRPAIYGAPLVYVAVRVLPAVLKAARAAAKANGSSVSEVIHQAAAVVLGVPMPERRENAK